MLISIVLHRLSRTLLSIWIVSCCMTRSLADEPKVRLFDGFEEEFALEWETVRFVEEHVSLTKNPGKLTLTTEFGTLGLDEVRRGPANNLHLVSNPHDGDGDFVVTTCVESFKPTQQHQQAGLLVYDDDDNYLKYDMEFNNGAVRFKHMRETNRLRLIDKSDDIVPESERIWLRLAKRGNVYERAYSLDGKEFKSAGESTWGDGKPQWIGLIAVNGTSTEEHTDAIFDFFEVRPLTEKEASDARYLERQKLQGSWDVIETVAGGVEIDEAYSSFQFDAGRVSFVENSQTMTVDYGLDLSKEPNAIAMAAFARGAKMAMKGSYRLDGDSLTICFSLDANQPAPDKLESEKGDARLLLKMKRSVQVEDETPADLAP